MVKATDIRSGTYESNRRQAGVLLACGLVCLLIAWLVKPDTASYPLGVLLLGLGMLVAAIFSPARLIIGGCMVTAIGVAVFLFFKKLIPGNEAFPTYILALGCGLLAVALGARRGYVGKGAVTPAIIVIAIGIIEILLVGGQTPATFVPFMLSFWLPGIGLLILGIIYFLTDGQSWQSKDPN